MSNAHHDHEDEHEREHDPRESCRLAPTGGGALVSLEALAAALNSVDTASRRPLQMPMLQFKREGDGTWQSAKSGWSPNRPAPGLSTRGASGTGLLLQRKEPGDRRAAGARHRADARPRGTAAEGFRVGVQWAVNLKCLSGTDAGVEVVYKRRPLAASSRRRTDRDGAGSAQRRSARQQGLADRSSRQGQLPARPIRPRLDTGPRARRLDDDQWAGASPRAEHRGRRLPSAAPPTCNPTPPARRVTSTVLTSDSTSFFRFRDPLPGPDLKAVGTVAYAATAEAIVCAFAVGDAAPRDWHADGAPLDWDDAPDDLREAFESGRTIGAWNASFDSAIWNYATLGFPSRARAGHRPDDPGRRLEPADRSRKCLALAWRRGQAEGRQKADPAVLRRGRGPRGASRRMDTLSPLRAPGRRGDARHLSADPTAADRGMAPVLGLRAHQPARRCRRRALRRARRALAAEDGVAIGRRLAELTNGIATKVTQAQRLADLALRTAPRRRCAKC